MVLCIALPLSMYLPYIPTDIDECAAEQPPCGEDQFCKNTPGSSSCHSEHPFDVSLSLQIRLWWISLGMSLLPGCSPACKGCVGSGASNCKECASNCFRDGDACVGQFSCLLISLVCRVFWELMSVHCSSACHKSCASCTDASAKSCIECKDGYERNDEGECIGLYPSVSLYEVCFFFSQGSHLIVCSFADIDECLTRADECNEDQICVNSPGSWHCGSQHLCIASYHLCLFNSDLHSKISVLLPCARMWCIL